MRRPTPNEIPGRPGRWLAAALLTVAFTAGAVAAPPDWNQPDDPLVGALGLHAGKIGGTGLAFRGPLAVWYLQWQVAGGIWNTGDDKRHDVGLEIDFLLRQDPRLRLFLAGGVGYYYHKHRQDRVDGTPGWDTDKTVNAGFGVGVEYLLSSRWSLKIDADFTYEGADDAIILWP